MMVLDISVPPAVLDWVEFRTTSDGAEQACVAEVTPFDGWALARNVLELPGAAPAESLAVCASVTVETALNQRGDLVVNAAGRVGVTVGWHLVAQPAGRGYVLADTDASWWVSGWQPATVTRTLTTFFPHPVGAAADNPTPLPFNMRGPAAGTVDWVGAAVGSSGSVSGVFGAVLWVGAAAGTVPRSSTVVGAVAWAGTAGGARPVSGSATGTVGWAGTAGGVLAQTGQAAGTARWAGAVTGGITADGVILGGFFFTGAASGTQPVTTGFGYGRGPYGHTPYGH